MKSLFGKFFLVVMLSALAAPLFAQQMEDAPRDNAYERHLTERKKAIPYDRLRQADVFWEKRVWRVIDFREKINLPFAYPKQPIAEVLVDMVMSGEVQAYNPLDDDFATPYTIEEITDKLNSTDTISVFDPDTYEETTTIVDNEFDPAWVIKLQVKEDWIFDEETSSMVVRIIGIAPVKETIDEFSGLKIGDELMFWLHYPSLREKLANAEAFNPHNDAIRMSWDDIFEMRMFSSYVVKESNVYDRIIENYSSGIDAVIESENIKRKIFKFEHELWEF